MIVGGGGGGMIKMASKGVCTSAIMVSVDPLSPHHQLLWVWRLQKTPDDAEQADEGDIQMEYSCD